MGLDGRDAYAAEFPSEVKSIALPGRIPARRR